jgi:type IV secretion system protein VirB10
MTDAPTSPAPVAKEAPEALMLRARPRSVKRLSKKVLAVLIGVSAIAVAAAAMFALRPSGRSNAPAEQAWSTDHKATADGLATLPGDYTAVPPAGVPRLGAPLPGDLGGPIVRAQQEGRMDPGVQAGPIPSQAQNPAEQAAAAEHQRRVQEVRAAIGSPLLAFSKQGGAAALADGAAGAAQPSLTQPVATASVDTSGGGRREAFMTAKPADAETLASGRLQAPDSPYTLMAGSIIAAALVTGLNSDLPGQVVATVTAPAFDTVTGRHLLVPQGSRLIGTYDSQTGYGEQRALLVWTRLILPDGSSITLDRMPATDQAGYAGVSDQVNNHWGRLASGAALSTILGVAAELAAPQNQGGDGRIIIAGRDGLQDSVNQVGQEITRRNLDIKPTITVRPGFPIRVLVNRDVVLARSATPLGRECKAERSSRS